MPRTVPRTRAVSEKNLTRLHCSGWQIASCCTVDVHRTGQTGVRRCRGNSRTRVGTTDHRRRNGGIVAVGGDRILASSRLGGSYFEWTGSSEGEAGVGHLCMCGGPLVHGGIATGDYGTARACVGLQLRIDGYERGAGGVLRPIDFSVFRWLCDRSRLVWPGTGSVDGASHRATGQGGFSGRLLSTLRRNGGNIDVGEPYGNHGDDVAAGVGNSAANTEQQRIVTQRDFHAAGSGLLGERGRNRHAGRHAAEWDRSGAVRHRLCRLAEVWHPCDVDFTTLAGGGFAASVSA